MSESVTAIAVAVITVSGVLGSAWIASNRVSRKVERTLATGNGHSAGQAIANIETHVKSHSLMLAEHAASLQGLDRRTAGTNDLLVQHLAEVAPLTAEFQEVKRRVMEQTTVNVPGAATVTVQPTEPSE